MLDGHFRISLTSLLIWLGALPLWAFLVSVVGNSPGFGQIGFLVAPIVLMAATAAIFRLFRGTKSGLAISALLAGMILAGALLIISLLPYS